MEDEVVKPQPQPWCLAKDGKEALLGDNLVFLNIYF